MEYEERPERWRRRRRLRRKRRREEEKIEMKNGTRK